MKRLLLLAALLAASAATGKEHAAARTACDTATQTLSPTALQRPRNVERETDRPTSIANHPSAQTASLHIYPKASQLPRRAGCGQLQQTAEALSHPALDRTGWPELPGKTRMQTQRPGENNTEATGRGSATVSEDNTFAECPATNEPLICFTHDRLPSDSTLRNYTFGFDPARHCSLWVAYPLHDCYIGQSDRTNRFGFDPGFDTSMQADIGRNAYYPEGGGKACHSRGHQLPSADRTASTEDNLTTFYATNMTPQLQTLNGVRWAELERNVRNWRCCDTLYVVTGAWFDPERTPRYAYDAKGAGKACPVPTHYYKVLLRSKTGTTRRPLRELQAGQMQCIGFWFDHDDPAAWNVAACVRSVEEIERLTGFTFFVNVPQAPKAAAEPHLWPGIK